MSAGGHFSLPRSARALEVFFAGDKVGLTAGMLEMEVRERMNGILMVEDVKQLIERARGNTAGPVGLVRVLFEGLGESATLISDVLQQALQESGIPLTPEVNSILGGIQSLEKNGDQLKLMLSAELQPTVRDMKVKLEPTISCAVQEFPDGIALVGISGVSVNQFIWIDIQRLHFKEIEGKRSVRVDTNYGGKEFQLP